MFRRAVPSRSSSATVTSHRRTSRTARTSMSWSPTEAAAMMTAPDAAVSTGAALSGVTVTSDDRRAEEAAVAARLDRAWRRLDEARTATEGRPGGIGDDTARRDPLTQPFPIAFGTPARTARPSGPAAVGLTPVRPAAPHRDQAQPGQAQPGQPQPTPAQPARMPVPTYAQVPVPTPSGAVPAGPRPSAPRTLRRPLVPAPQVARVRPARRLTADRWTTATG